MSSPEEWYIDDGTRVAGPVTPDELRARALDGRLRRTDRVSPDGKTWREAVGVDSLLFSAPPGASALLPPTQLSSAESTEPRGEDAEWPQIPGYEVLGVLGKGGCGVVYKARQTALDRLVALKTVPFADRANPQLAARFGKEAVALARLQHPNIVSIFDCGRHGDRAYFAMEMLKGDDLGNRIVTVGRLDERTAWAVARQTAAALAHAAAEGIYHRDIKPANLFLVPMPTGFGFPADLPLVKVTDFGLALSRRVGEQIDLRLTAAGAVVGTPTYMAPEQFQSSDVDHRADIYALGTTVYAALTGNVPFPGPSIWDVVSQKTSGPPRLGLLVSDESSALVEAMMAPKPADRISSYDELIARIDALPAMAGVFRRVAPAATSAVSPVVPSPTLLLPEALFPEKPARTGRWRSRTVAVAAAFAAVLAVGLYAASVGGGLRSRPPAPPPPSYQPSGFEDSLFRGDALGWVATGGQPVTVEADDEKTPVLTVGRAVKRGIPPLPDFRLTLGFDLYKATEADVTACVPAGPNPREEDPTAPRLVLRISRANGAAFGMRAGEKGDFTPLGPTVPFPSAAEMENRRPYLEVRIERTTGTWTAWFHGTKVGTAPDDGPAKLSEVRVRADGPVRLDTALVEGLAPAP